MEITEEQLEAIHQTFVRLESIVVPSTKHNDLFFDYSLLPCKMLFDAINTVNGITENKRFLDIGCGIGTSLTMMHFLGFEVSGIDREPSYITIAKELCPSANLKIANLFNIEYFDADIILMTHPARLKTMQRAIENYVVNRVAKDTILILPGSQPPIGTSYVDGYVSMVN